MHQQGRPPGARPPGLRPLSFGELLDQVFRVYRRRFGAFVALALILTLPVLLFQAAGSGAQMGYVLDLMQNRLPLTDGTSAPPLAPNLVLTAASYIVSLAILPFTMGTLVVAALRLIDGRPLELAPIFRVVLHRYFALLGLAFLYAATALSLLCLPVGIWLLVRFSVAVPALIAEQAGPVRALGRSWALSEGGWWRTFGLLAVLYLIAYVVGSVLGLFGLPLLLVPFLPSMVRGALYVAVSGLSGALVLPLTSIAVALLYVDLRVRREAYDLDQLAREATAALAP
jgi:hypothetical protein